MNDISRPDDSLANLDLGQTIRGFNAGQKLFGRYTLQKILGRGGMGVVWLARDEKLEREVALKFLPELMVFDEQAVVDLKRETKKSQELRHHHIVSVYDFVSDDHSACIAMEYVDGPTLSALKARKENNCLEVGELKPWIEQLCEALSYAHEKAKVVHRDLKPANLMVNGREELKVTDFGIARSVSDSMSVLTMHRGTSGTLVYMSPQQINGERATPLDDIYSLGATVYELLTSKPPFYSGSIERQIHEKTPTSIAARRMELGLTGADIPRNWEETVAQCLAKDPAQRPQSAAAVANALGLKSTSYAATPAVTPATATAGPRKRKMAPFLIGGAAALLVLVAIGYYGWQRSQGTPPQAGTIAPPQPTTSAVPAQPNAAPQIAAASPAVSVSPVMPPAATQQVESAPAASPAPSTTSVSTNTPIDQNAQVVVFTYHRLADKVRYPGTEITPAAFEAQMKKLKDRGITVIPMQDLLAWKRGEKNIPPRCAVITFDDGWKSQYEVAWPIMKKFGYPFTMFIYTEGVAGGILGGGEAITWEQLADMRDNGVDIQAHSATHQDLREGHNIMLAAAGGKRTRTKLTGPDYEKWVQNEVVGSKELLEQRLGIKVNCFALPYGFYDEHVQEVARNAGYEALFTLYGQTLTYSSPLDSLGRYAIEANKPKIFPDAIGLLKAAKPRE